MLNVCMVGHGMMGVWHSEALQRVPDCQPHTVVGRPPSPEAKATPTAGRAEWQQPPPRYSRGYGSLYLRHITQANDGCDFDLLEAGPPTPEPEIH